MSARRGPLLRLLLAIIDAGRWLAPASRRRDWRRQWRADILHEWQWLARRPHDIGARADLMRRAAGALYHAFWLRLHVRSLEMITHDLRYGWRLMVRKPGFTAVAVLTLGLGIGANVTIFSWVDTMLLRPLRGVADADRIVAMNGTTRTRNNLAISYPDFVDYRQRRPASVDDLIAFTLIPMNLRTENDPQRVFGQLVSGNFFEVLGAHPILGRGFLPEEDRTPNAHPVIVLSHSFWLRRFAGDPATVGRTVTLNGRAFTVIGVGPAGFRGSEVYLNIDVWVPMMMQAAITSGDRLSARGNSWLEVLVKLKPGVPMARADSDLNAVARDLAAAYPDDAGRGVKLYEQWRAPHTGGDSRVLAMSIQMAVVGVVLLIACANVANLLLARAASRQRETAVRLAMGASRARLVQQLLTESTLLAVAGGAAGLMIAYWAAPIVQWFVPPAPLPIEMDPKIGGRVLTYALGVTMASTLFFGLVPALQAASASVLPALKESAGAITGTRRRARLRQSLCVAQVALSLVLLVSAGLFLRAVRNAQAADPGFTTRNGLLASIDLLPAGYDATRGRAFFRELLSRVRQAPGVEAASLASKFPLGFGGTSDFTVRIDGYTPAPNEELSVYFNRVGSDYLRTMGIAIVAGRDFTDRDTADIPDVGIVNETIVRRYFSGRDPIGGRIRAGTRIVQVIGVARDGKYSTLSEAPRPYLYLPLDQWYRPDMILHVKTAGDPAALVSLLHSVLRSLDANVPLFDVRTIADQLEVASFVQRMLASLLGAFGGLALLLASVGLYGVIAALVAQRTPEIGMRMALGADRGDIIALVMKQGLGVTIGGVALGLAGAVAVTRFFRTLLVGVSATDTLSFAVTVAMLVAVAMAAVYIPARRAAAVDPLIALRQD
jgi:predicted permease